MPIKMGSFPHVNPVPLPTVPQRPQFDGMALGKEFADTIRRNKTMGAINKALEQHGTLSSPEAIETVRQGMGTWFSDPQTVIGLQDKAYKRSEEAAKQALEVRKVDVEKELAEGKIEADKAAALLVAEATVTAQGVEDAAILELETLRLDERRTDNEAIIEAAKVVAGKLKEVQDRAAAKALSTRQHENTRKRLEIQTASIDKQIDTIYKRATADLQEGLTSEQENRLTALMQQRKELTDIAISTTMKAEDFEAYKIERDKERYTPRTEKEKKEANAVQLQESTIKIQKQLKAMPIDDLINLLPDVWYRWTELSDKLDDEVKNIAQLEQRIATKESLGLTSAFAIQNLEKNKKSLEESNEKLARLRAEAEKTLLEQELKKLDTTTSDDAQGAFVPREGLGSVGGGDLVDQFTQMALNSPQGQDMMRRLMEEQQIVA